jgi:hypothetical protein
MSMAVPMGFTNLGSIPLQKAVPLQNTLNVGMGLPQALQGLSNVLTVGLAKANPPYSNFPAGMHTGFSNGLMGASGVGYSLSNTLPSHLSASLSGVLGATTGSIPPSKEIPIIPLSQSDINKTYPNISHHIYERNQLQCKQCGIRFETLPNGKDELEKHLDWHFRQKKRQRERKQGYSRDWYHSVEDWIQEQPVDLPDQGSID